MKENILLEMFKKLVLIRETEKEIARRYPEQEMRCPVHLSLGQEASAVGVCAGLNAGDHVYATHRGHAAYLACGGNLKRLLAELYGKAVGCTGGRGGSMHIIDESAGFFGTSAIVGGTIPIAVGDAFAAKLDGSRRIVVVFFGDGAVEEGVFYESLNFASIHKLPVVFVCENNGLATNSASNIRESFGNIHKKGEAFAIKNRKVDGRDVLAVFNAFSGAKENILRGNGPFLVECAVNRWADHVGPNYKIDIENCPVKKYRNFLLAEKLFSETELAVLESSIKDELENAFYFAKESSFAETV
ncbi:MAG: thiamine pyrophosphate-dependent dehydrogenase E1 component subunit alpha [Candidatus Paceibacterota bacterium]